MHQKPNAGKAAVSSMGQKGAHSYQDKIFNLA